MNSSWRLTWSALLSLGVGLWPVTEALGAPAPDACAVLQKADVEAAFAPRVFGSGKLGPVVVKVTEKNASWLAAVTDCTVTSTEASAKDRLSVTLQLRRAPSDATGVTPEQARAGSIQLKATPVDVPGLGAGAYWVDLGSSSRPVIQLNVFRGKRDWLIFSASGKKPSAAATLAGLTSVAKAAAARP